MTTRLRQLWESRAPRERLLLAMLACVLLVIAYGWLIYSAERARAPLRLSVVQLRAQAVRLDQQALEFSHLRAAPVVTTSGSDLYKLVQDRVAQAGLAHALTRIDAPDADHVVVVFGAVAFADFVDWIAGLKAQHIRLDACRVEALSTPGLVSVSATVNRPKPQ